jgi:hypothetical protein
MTGARGDEVPLDPVYPFNDAGASIVLHDGPLGGAWAGSRRGVVEFSFGCRPGLRWYIKPEDGDFHPDLEGVRLRLGRRGGDWAVDAYHRDHAGGWINNADFADPDACMRRVLVHWMNLPAIWGPIALHEQTASGEKWWKGRWRADIDEWSITLDQRHDHTEVLKDAHATHLYVLTHVMEIRRKDG